MESDFFIGLDLGQTQDYSALAVVERITRYGVPTTYSCGHLHRWPLGTAYPQVVADVQKLVTTTNQRGIRPLRGAKLVVDATGVGRPVADMLSMVPELAGRIVPVVITAGLASSSGNDGTWHVSKKELVSILQVQLQSRQLQISGQLDLAATLEEELRTFRVKITAAANETFEAWRERNHDDVLMALAVAVWYAERNPAEEWAEPVVLIPGPDLFGPGYGAW